jgi:Kef-type K+ transport system membrane component KefB
MITQDHIAKLWKRTVIHLIVVCIGAVGIVIYLVVDETGGKRLNLSSAFGVLLIIVAAAITFFFVGRYIKKVISGRYGQSD